MVFVNQEKQLKIARLIAAHRQQFVLLMVVMEIVQQVVL
jgi:hypothetical protein